MYFAIYKQNVSISLCSSDSVQCRKGYYFPACMLYFSFGARYICSSDTHNAHRVNNVTLEWSCNM